MQQSRAITINECYARLAAAIVNSGIVSHDITFLESDWCGDLRELVKIYNMHGHHKVRIIEEVDDDSK